VDDYIDNFNSHLPLPLPQTIDNQLKYQHQVKSTNSRPKPFSIYFQEVFATSEFVFGTSPVRIVEVVGLHTLAEP